MIDYDKFKLVDITKPKTGATVYCNKYWECIDNEAKAVFYGKYPQCNSNENIMKHLTSRRQTEKLEKKFKGESKIIFVPVAYFVDERKYD